MAKQKSKKHHSKPHGGGVSYAQRLAQQRMLKQALDNEVLHQKAELFAKQDTQRALWLMVCSIYDAFGIGAKRLQRDFFPALQENVDDLNKKIREDGEVYAFEKLRLKAEAVSGIEIRHFYDPDPAAALAREEQQNENHN